MTELEHIKPKEIQGRKSKGRSKSADSQTVTEDIQIPCNICIYVATCEEQLNWHMGEDHNLTSDSYFYTDYLLIFVENGADL